MAQNLPNMLLMCLQQKARRRGQLLDICAERFPEHDRRVISSLIIQVHPFVAQAVLPRHRANKLYL